MLKRFFVAFAGSLSAIWLSIGLFFVLIVLMAAMGLMAGISTEGASLKPHSVLMIDLSSDIDERATAPSFSDFITSRGSASATVGLNEIVTAIDVAATDNDIEGIYIQAGGGTAGLATRMSIVEALKRFKKSNKWIIAYGDGYEQGDYIVASAADSILINPMGVINVAGLASQTPFFKNFLDKVGVEMQVVKVGTYKSAVEPFLLDNMSEASREQQMSYLSGIWGTLTKQISDSRHVTAQQVNMWADSLSSTWTTTKLLQNKLADKAVYQHEAKELIARLTDNIDDPDEVNFLSPSQYVALKGMPHAKGKKKIAVLYAVGDIVDDGDGGIVATQIVPEIEDIIDDEDVAGLILRVNSGGGSAFASEQIWEALERFKKTERPLYVSMGDMAASGGYYISCGADKIFAQPQTLTGSIGIFGMIPCIKGLTDKLGVNFGMVATNPDGAHLSLTEPMTPTQLAAMQNMVNYGYETFVKRCAEGRNMPVDKLKSIAEGRVWDGQQALKNGLVDQLGTLHDAIAAMSKQLKLDEYRLVELPEQSSTLWDQIMMAQGQIQENQLRATLGDTYTLYTTMNQMLHWSPIQCRMEFVEIK